MTLLDRMLERGVDLPVDPIIAARIERHINRIRPDPLFQRRLRGQVLNRYVATREGMIAPTRPARVPRRGLSALGRGMLYASLLTAVSATAVGAAAQESLPGDLLYGVKLELETIRMELAPAAVRDDLAALALDERLDEVEALAAAGRWDEMDAAVARVLSARALLAALASPVGGQVAGLLPDHADRLAALLATAPDAERRGLLRALAVSGGSPSDVHSNRDHTTKNRGQRKGQHVAPVAPVAPSGTAQPIPTPTTPPATPTASATPSPTANPTPPSPPQATPTPSPGGGSDGHDGGTGPSTRSSGNGAK